MTGAPARIAGAAAGIAAATLAARVVGLGRWLVFSRTVGASCVGEAYATANVLPNVLFEVAAGGALAAVVVPLVAGALSRGDRAEADRLASTLLTWALTVLLPAAVLLALAAPWLASALLSDVHGCSGDDQHRLAASMLVIFAPQVPLYAVGIVLTGVLQAHRRFMAAALAPLASSLVVIVAYLAYDVLQGDAGGVVSAVPAAAVVALAGGTTLGVVALSLPLLVPARRAGVRLRPSWQFPPGAARTAARLAGAGVLALAAQQVAVLATTKVSNAGGGQGAVNVYTYVQALYLLPYAVLAVPIATAAFPDLVGRGPGRGGTQTPAGGEPDREPAALLGRALSGVVVAGALGAALLIAAAPAAQAFFEHLDAARSGPGAASLAAMADALDAYALGLLGYAVVALLQRAMYVRGNAWRGAAAVAAGWLLAALVPLLVVDPGDGSRQTLRVLGWSSSAGMILSALALLVLVRRAWGPLPGTGRLSRTAATTLVTGAVAAMAGRLAVTALDPGGLLSAVLAAVVAAVAVLLVFATLRITAPQAWSGLRRPRARAAS